MSYILITNSDGVSLSLVHADDEGAYLAHHGVKGQRWGVRRFQNPDGSLTQLGAKRRHYQTTLNDLDKKNVGDVPNHLKDAHYAGASKLGVGGYKYPHDYEYDYVKQQYMPDNLKDTVYYEAKNNKYEESLRKYWENIKFKR